MAHKRTEFTENQKAEIFVRDRATCAFSGLSLWQLDYGIRPNRQIDWVDHIKPSASGGKASLDNGVCASHTFNAKKKGNAHDNICFVKHGKVTEDYIWVFGMPKQDLLSQLHRLSSLEVADWYFNKCIDNMMEGLNWRCEIEFKNVKYKRDDAYWFEAGWKRLLKFRKNTSGQSMQDRGLLTSPLPFGAELLLEAQNLVDKDEYLGWAEDVFPMYRASYKLLHDYFQTGSMELRQVVLVEAAKDSLIHPEVLKGLELMEYES
jgi:hypothetical protein